MMRAIVLGIGLSFFLSSCKNVATNLTNSAGDCDRSPQNSIDEGYSVFENDPSGDTNTPPRDCNIPTQEPGANLTYTVVLRDFNLEQEEKMREALERAKLAINSMEFRDRVLGHTYNGKETFVDNNGQSNYEIYETIMKGAETLKPQADNNMDLDFTLYYTNNSTVGYTYPNTMKIWINAKFFNGYTLGKVAANAVHEWTHKLGYGHSKYNNSSRPYSVPYAIGSIISDIVDNM